MACVTGMCCRVLYYACLAAICIYLVVCVLLVPQYRVVALMIFALVALYATSAWRRLPSEQLVVRERAEEMVKQRCPLPAEAAPLTFPETAGVTVAHSLPSFREPYRISA
ncbi:hypothetical protein LSCM1_03228 [Leishmania martiniquensis]|uniref:Uncharacterized protein n=1 Tax=Leishmania martiniquensis TaxID=1580590 RepID=A0A836GL84_9TRYP|nr:hypothetical protein LSCM1_03228 [Leishmania martiniquensis]